MLLFRIILGKPFVFQLVIRIFAKKTDDSWTKYNYGECQNTDTSAFCISSHGFKKFQLPLENVETGTHRLMIPVCTTCQEGQLFHEDQVIYSNEFIVR